jgi:hypothetical protein
MAIRRSNDPRRSTTPAPAAAPPAKTVASSPAAAPEARTTAPPRRRAGQRVEKAAGKFTNLSAETRRAMIAESAYLRSERRGFAAGFEEEDWLAAEKEIDALLSAGPGAPQ